MTWFKDQLEEASISLEKRKKFDSGWYEKRITELEDMNDRLADKLDDVLSKAQWEREQRDILMKALILIKAYESEHSSKNHGVVWSMAEKALKDSFKVYLDYNKD